MLYTQKVLLASRDQAMLVTLESCLARQEGVRIKRRQMVSGYADALQGIDELPDILILHLSEDWRAELESLARRPLDSRPHVIVLGSGADPEVMRHAIRAGARDFLSVPVADAELLEALTRLVKDIHPSASGRAALTVFMNGKGGSGATLLACNVAHIMAAASKQRVALIDLDLQFGTLPMYMDLTPSRGISQALANLDELDEVALEGYMTRHESGVNVLGNTEDNPFAVQDATGGQIIRLLDIAERSHDQIVVDLPRRIDDISVSVLEHATRVVIVVQQALTTLRDAGRLVQVLCRDIGLSRGNLCIVVNRYDKNAPVTLADIEKTLRCGDPVLVPNAFDTVTESINTGGLLYDRARNSAITRALMTLETRLGGNSATERPGGGLFARALSGLVKSR